MIKFYLYGEDPYEPKNELLFDKRETLKIKAFKWFNSFY